MSTAHALFATDAFYLAFRNKDVDAMDALWATRHDLCCIHPGWQVLHERNEIMETWQAILGNPNQGFPIAYGATALNWGTLIGVTCYEQLGEATLLATKLFTFEDAAWRLVMHSAGPCNEPPPMPSNDVEMQ